MSELNRPVPSPLHIQAAEAEDKKQQAIRAVMGRDAVDYPTAAKTVAAEGVDAVLAKREAGNTAEALADKEKKDAEFNAKVETVMREDGISWKAAAKKVNS